MYENEEITQPRTWRMDVRKKTVLIAALLATALLAIGTPAKAQEAPPGCPPAGAAGVSDGCDSDDVNVLPGRGGSSGNNPGGSSSESNVVSSSSVTSVRSQEVGDVVYYGAAPYDTGGSAVFVDTFAAPMVSYDDAYVAAPTTYPAVVPAVLPVSSPQAVE